jgi:hypothetical protein
VKGRGRFTECELPNHPFISSYGLCMFVQYLGNSMPRYISVHSIPGNQRLQKMATAMHEYSLCFMCAVSKGYAPGVF